MVRVERLPADCLEGARAESPGTVPLAAHDAGCADARRTFLTAGLPALRAHAPEAGRVQLDVCVRFRAAEPSGAEDLRAALLRRPDPGRQGHSWARPVPGVYEPESCLFGGPRSTPWAHALCTAGSRPGRTCTPPRPVSRHRPADGCPWRCRTSSSTVWASSAGSTVGSGRSYRRRPGAGCRAGSARRTGAGPPPVSAPTGTQGPGARLGMLPKPWRDVLGEHPEATCLGLR
ncbi:MULTISPECIES: hypothetical protein [Streptomyces]|uniref:Uncharacterized protein n=1 Tax=Streptomyces canarius TaxID=285453 RepID=A0ABQ3DAQ0_9ACTN|nr:hypothetical protein [Streptomyces canarius]GHA58454.1 hypothetical protein GCM10010345_73480 [Streptomyces canarius]